MSVFILPSYFFFSALLASVNVQSSSYSGKEKLSSIAASLWGAMEEGGKVSELRSQRWQWLLAAEAKETHSEPNPKEANVSGWQWLAAETKAPPSELTLKEVDLLPKVQHLLMQHLTLLLSIEK